MSARLDAMVREARAGLRRVTPSEAFAAAGDGALLVDIRPESHRVDEGAIPGAVVIERNVLEWRLDPAGDHRTDRLRDAGAGRGDRVRRGLGVEPRGGHPPVARTARTPPISSAASGRGRRSGSRSSSDHAVAADRRRRSARRVQPRGRPRMRRATMFLFTWVVPPAIVSARM